MQKKVLLKPFPSGWSLSLKYNFTLISFKYKHWKIVKDLLCIKQTSMAVFSRDEHQYSKRVGVWGILSKPTFFRGKKKRICKYLLQFGLGICLFTLYTVWISVQFYNFSRKSIHGVKNWIPTINKSIPKLKYATNMKIEKEYERISGAK